MVCGMTPSFAATTSTTMSVTGRVEKSNLREFLFALRVRHGNGVGADVLRDAAGLARRDVRFADDVEQRGFAMIHVAHDGHDRRARLEVFQLVVNVEFDFFLDRVDNAFALRPLFNFKLEAVFCAKLLGDFFVNRLIDGGENTELDQIADDDERLLLELLGKLADDDRRLDDDDCGGVRQVDLGACRRGGLGRLARGLRRLAAIARALKLPPRVWSLRRARARRRQFGTSAFFAGARSRARWQLDEPDLVANLRADRFGRWRWR
jgi:hypothetical protein